MKRNIWSCWAVCELQSVVLLCYTNYRQTTPWSTPHSPTIHFVYCNCLFSGNENWVQYTEIRLDRLDRFQCSRLQNLCIQILRHLGLGQIWQAYGLTPSCWIYNKVYNVYYVGVVFLAFSQKIQTIGIRQKSIHGYQRLRSNLPFLKARILSLLETEFLFDHIVIWNNYVHLVTGRNGLKSSCNLQNVT